MTMLNNKHAAAAYVDNLGVNSWYTNLAPNLITVHTRWGTHCGSGNETNNMVDEGLKVWQCVFGDLF